MFQIHYVKTTIWHLMFHNRSILEYWCKKRYLELSSRITKLFNCRFSKPLDLGLICKIKPGVWVIDGLLCLTHNQPWINLSLYVILTPCFNWDEDFAKPGVGNVLWFGLINWEENLCIVLFIWRFQSFPTNHNLKSYKS